MADTCFVFQHHTLIRYRLRFGPKAASVQRRRSRRNAMSGAARAAVKRCQRSDGSRRRCGQLSAVRDERDICGTNRAWSRGARGRLKTEKWSKDCVGHNGPRNVIFTDLQVISQTFELFWSALPEGFCADGSLSVFRRCSASGAGGGVKFARVNLSGKSDFHETPRTRAK